MKSDPELNQTILYRLNPFFLPGRARQTICRELPWNSGRGKMLSISVKSKDGWVLWFDCYRWDLDRADPTILYPSNLFSPSKDYFVQEPHYASEQRNSFATGEEPQLT